MTSTFPPRNDITHCSADCQLIYIQFNKGKSKDRSRIADEEAREEELPEQPLTERLLLLQLVHRPSDIRNGLAIEQTLSRGDCRREECVYEGHKGAEEDVHPWQSRPGYRHEDKHCSKGRAGISKESRMPDHES